MATASAANIPIMQPVYEWGSDQPNESFKKFKAQATLLPDKGPLSNIKCERKVPLILNWMGWEAQRLFKEELEIEENNKKDHQRCFLPLKTTSNWFKA